MSKTSKHGGPPAVGGVDTSESGAEAASKRSRPLLTRLSASAYLKAEFGIPIEPATLARKASAGGGPPFRKAGRVPLYDPDELDAWARELVGKRRATTSDPGTPAPLWLKGGSA